MLAKKAEYQLDLFNPWFTRAAFFTGLSFFLRALYYFGFGDIVSCGLPVILLELVAPMVLLAAVMLALRIFLSEDPRVYAVLGVLACILLLVWAFLSGDVIHTAMAFVWYIAAAVVLVLTAWGILPTPVPAKAAFVVPILFRVLLGEYGELYFRDWKLIEFLPEASVLCMMAVFACLMLALEPAEPEEE